MKARVKATVRATGEIVEVQRLCMSSEGDIWQTETGQEYLDWMLDFDFKEEPTPEYKPDYWERIKHQAMIAAMQAIITNPIGFESLRASSQGSMSEAVADIAKGYASDLVSKMREDIRNENS